VGNNSHNQRIDIAYAHDSAVQLEQQFDTRQVEVKRRMEKTVDICLLRKVVCFVFVCHVEISQTMVPLCQALRTLRWFGSV
jgi:hypothetical protein